MPYLARMSPICGFVSVWWLCVICPFKGPYWGFSPEQTGVWLMSWYSGCRTWLISSLWLNCWHLLISYFSLRRSQWTSLTSPRLILIDASQLFSTSVKHTVTFYSFSGSSWVVKTFCFTHGSPSFSPDTFLYPSAAPCHHLLSARQKIARVLCPATFLSTGARQWHLSARRQVKKSGSSHGWMTADTSRFTFQG